MSGDRSAPTLTHRLRASLIALHVVAGALLLRSVIHERWITVVASLLLIAGAAAALRGRTWGVVLALAAATSFPVAWALGMAPVWFCLVGVVGALPLALSFPAFAKVDRGATIFGTFLAGASGLAAAAAWRVFAPLVFEYVPSLRPSFDANNRVAAVGVVAIAALAILRSRAGRSPSSCAAAASRPVRRSPPGSS